MSRRLLGTLTAALLPCLGLGLAGVGVGAAAAQAADGPRIVALTPFTANTLSLLGVKPLAIGQTLGGTDRFNAGLRGVKTLTLSHPFGPNLEQLAVLDPQLVLSAPVWAKGNQSMKGMGIRVVESDPKSVADVSRQTEFIGQVVGRRAAAARTAAKQRARIRVAESKIKSHPTVLLVLGLGRSVQAFMPDSWGGDVIAHAGGRLLTQGLPSLSEGFGKISDELIVARNPDVIIAVPHGTPSNIPRITRFLASNPAWKNTKAARNGRIYVSTDNSLLQAMPQSASVIAAVQKNYLRNAGR